MKIDHIGYAVKKMERARNAFQALGYAFSEVIDDPERNVQISFGEKDGYRIELVCPLDPKKESPVDAYLRKIGPEPYHICYCSENLEEDIQLLKQNGFRVVIEPKEAVAFGGKRVVFLAHLGLGLLEIVEE